MLFMVQVLSWVGNSVRLRIWVGILRRRLQRLRPRPRTRPQLLLGCDDQLWLIRVCDELFDCRKRLLTARSELLLRTCTRSWWLCPWPLCIRSCLTSSCCLFYQFFSSLSRRFHQIYVLWIIHNFLSSKCTMLLKWNSLIFLCNHSLAISLSYTLCLDRNITRCRTCIIIALKWFSIHRLKRFLCLFHERVLICWEWSERVLVCSFKWNVAWLEHCCSLDIWWSTALLNEAIIHILNWIWVGRLFLSFEYASPRSISWNVRFFRQLSRLRLFRL